MRYAVSRLFYIETKIILISIFKNFFNEVKYHFLYLKNDIENIY